MMDGVGADNGIEDFALQPVGKTGSKIVPNQNCIRHFAPGNLNHSFGEINSGDVVAVPVQACGQNSCTEANIQHTPCVHFPNSGVNRPEYLFVSGKGISVLFIGYLNTAVIAVSPQIKAI